MEIAIIFILGTIFGSFMNVCIYRMPKNESIIKPRSKCMSCGKKIAWFDNIPILSYILLLGKCRKCKSKFSPRYMVVELISGIVYVLLYLHFGLSVKFLAMCYLASSLIVVSFIDLDTYEIPDSITLSGIALGLIISVISPSVMGKTIRLEAGLDSLFGILVGGGIIFILGVLGEFVFKKEAMGGGDVKLLAMIGAFIGWKLAIFTFFLAPFFGAFAGIFMKLKYGKEVIPYGPYLSIAAIIAIFWGEEIIRTIFLI